MGEIPRLVERRVVAEMIWIMPWVVAVPAYFIGYKLSDSPFTAQGCAVLANGLCFFIGGWLKWQ